MTVETYGFAFDTPIELIGYTALHAETERALMRLDQIAVLGLVAGVETDEEFLKSSDFISLHSVNALKEVIDEARERVISQEVDQSTYEDILSKWAEAQKK